MLKVLGKIPREVVVAVSGGPDSMAILDFLSNNHDVTAAYFDHGTPFGEDCKYFVKDFCEERNIPLVVGNIYFDCPPEKSLEEHWRDERYKFFRTFEGKVVTGHNLDDVIEWFLFSSLHGQGRIIPYSNREVIRPFISTSKRSLEDWCERKDVPFMVDPGNTDRKFMRSIIRNDIMPHARKVNQGLKKTFKKLVENEFNSLY